MDAKLGMHGYGAPHPNYMCQMQQAHVYQTSRCVLLQAQSSEKQQRWTQRKRTTTKSSGQAGVLQTKANMLAQKPPPCTRLAGTPLPFKVRVLKASAKNPGPLTPPHGHSSLKVEPQPKTTTTWRASAKPAQNRLTPPPRAWD